MKLLDYIRGLRKGKEAHRLEKSRCKTLSWPMLWMVTTKWREITNNGSRNCGCRFLLIRQKKRTPYAITWSIAACLVIGFGISSYFLFLKKSMTDEVFIAKESVSSKLAEPAVRQLRQFLPLQQFRQLRKRKSHWTTKVKRIPPC